MNLPEIRNANLESFLDKQEIVKALIAQISKDLGMYGIELHFEENAKTTYQILHNELVSKIENLFKNDSSRLFSILYRVDISEKDLALAGIELPDYNHTEIVAHQIIKRELKKVLIRKYYKNEEN
ncbi:hypothetical protein EGI22_23895 [Lacihabitans sp. LS3-19]|uniref:hypothetical protein n=1 Tax=Lacihabitans sp. LS3-19 TaxID=2487335 RepID=UPI0020CD9CF2|nr:hypothetical protein [Lacihabitans sp. LS3-19]MCP9770959.1 hypothetical protein [Lacihabitans sp. LS3-19]